MYSRLVAACVFATACRPRPPSVLLFNGKGTSAGDVAAVEHVLRDAHLSYATANSRQLRAMREPATVAHTRSAVYGGLNYLGMCAGAFFAGTSPYNGLNLTSGVRFPFYAAEAAFNATPL